MHHLHHLRRRCCCCSGKKKISVRFSTSGKHSSLSPLSSSDSPLRSLRLFTVKNICIEIIPLPEAWIKSSLHKTTTGREPFLFFFFLLLLVFKYVQESSDACEHVDKLSAGTGVKIRFSLFARNINPFNKRLLLFSPHTRMRALAFPTFSFYQITEKTHKYFLTVDGRFIRHNSRPNSTSWPKLLNSLLVF